MTPERWKQVQIAFHEAVDRPGDEQSAYLDAVGAKDPDLRREVEALLVADEAPAALFGATPATLLGFVEERETEVVPSRIGPYRVQEEIGRGGMGAVYRAVRDDGHFSRDVAVKLVKRGTDTDEVVRRFKNERQILAGLEHPNIARLYDGGVSDDGRPYLVMEFIDGQPIDRFCHERRLSLAARLALFDTVCDAVEYAHRNLIVHRDLKPSNILVAAGPGRTPEVKLLDFGIAKLLDDDREHAAERTRTGIRVLTPRYAAPEQLRGEAITTATDVYALGILLYELLTGVHPFADVSQTDLVDTILQKEPVRPSTIVARSRKDEHLPPGEDADRMRRRLRGDLNTIVLRALRKEPGRRYASVEAFREDLWRHRRGLPVRARPDTLGYRSRKFVRRHRLGVASAAVVLILAIGISLWTALLQAETARERDRVQLERDRAEAVAALMKDLFNASDPFLATTERIDTLSVRALLDRGAERIQRENSNQPALQAEMLDVIGNVYLNLGVYDRAEMLISQALGIRRALHGETHVEVAQSLVGLARIDQARGAYAEAEATYRRAVTMLERAPERQPEGLMAAMHGLGSVLRDRDDFDAALETLQAALRISGPNTDAYELLVARLLLELGRVHQELGELVPAESLYQDVLERHRRVLGTDHPEYANSLENLATVMREQTKLEAAEPLQRQALALRRRVLGAEHPQTITSMYELAGLLRDRGAFDEAVPLLEEVLALDKKVLGDTHHFVGLDLRELGITLARMGALDQALAAYTSALDVLERTLPANHTDIAVTLSGIGSVHLQQGDARRAEAITRDVLDMRTATLGAASWWTGNTMSLLGACLTAQRRFDEAEPLLLQGYATVRDGKGPTAPALRRLVAFYEAVERPEDARRYQELLVRVSNGSMVPEAAE